MSSPSSRSTGFSIVPLAVTLLLTGPRVCSGAWTLPAAAKLDPRLAAAARLAPDDTLSVWVCFTDKGEDGPADLAARLAAAEAALTPKARARRSRAGVSPMVDELDLPVHPPYLSGLRSRGLAPLAVSRWLNRAATRLPGRRLDEVAALPFVAQLVRVERMRRSLGPENDARPLARAEARSSSSERVGALDHGSMQGPLAQIGIPEIHEAGFTGAGVLVAVLDAGFNYFTKHEALRDLVVPTERQRDFVRGVYDAQDTTNTGMVHGTWVLGCLAGQKVGTYVGAAFGADYALARTEIVETETPQEMLYWGMAAEWADSLGADIISSSVAYSTFEGGVGSYTYADMDGHTTLVSRFAEIAASKGILVVNSVGNEGLEPWHYLMAPSDVHGDSVIAVGAVYPDGAPAEFSSYGPSADGRIKPDLAARGVSVPLVGTSGDPQAYTSIGGTSFAAPMVAGLAACIMQARPTWSARDVAVVLRSTASRAAAPDDRVGYGIPNGPAALCGNPTVPDQRAALVLEHQGAHPVSLARGPAQFRLALGESLAGGQPREAVLEIRDIMGRRVGRAWSGVIPCGLGVNVTWDGRDRKGIHCGAGLFLVELRSGDDRASLRLVCLP